MPTVVECSSALITRLLGIVVACVTIVGCTAAPSAQNAVSVQLRWTHLAQFSGLYAADRNGYYRDERIGVKFIEGGPTADLFTPVINGTAQFGVAGAEALISQVASGKPLRAIAVIFQRSPIVFMTMAGSGITRPSDFVGKTIHVPTTATTFFKAMMRQAGLSADQYKTVNLDTDLTKFYAGEVQVWTGFITQWPPIIRSAGYEINIIYPDDYGIHFYSDCIFTTNDLIAKDPDLVLRFLRATLKGWTNSIDHPDTAGDLLNHYDPKADRKVANDYLIASIPLISTSDKPLGWMEADRWANMEQILRQQQVINNPVDINSLYTLQFLNIIYAK